jgi:hypothetical protein
MLPSTHCTSIPAFMQRTLQTGQHSTVEPASWYYGQDNNALLSQRRDTTDRTTMHCWATKKGQRCNIWASGMILQTGQHSTVELAVQHYRYDNTAPLPYLFLYRFSDWSHDVTRNGGTNYVQGQFVYTRISRFCTDEYASRANLPNTSPRTKTVHWFVDCHFVQFTFAAS